MNNQYRNPSLEAEIELFSIYTQLLRIRMIEEAIAERYSEWQMRCPVHLSIGQEAIPVGISTHLTKKDHVYSNHRSHGHYFAKGGSLKKMIAELYGKETGCCGGRGGSMHLIDLDIGFMGSTPIVGGTVPLAVGDAWSAKLKGEKRVSVIYFGDGCFEEGVLHESMNFAILHKLPVIFICENNGYSVYTKLNDRQPSRKIINIAKAHGMQVHTADGNDVLDIMKISYNAIEQARNDNKPQFFEFKTYRWLEHCGPDDDDHLKYRPQGELSIWKEKCPVEKLKNHIMSKNINYATQFTLIEKAIESEISDAFKFAINSNPPSIDLLNKHIYA
jgi:TPP-dependent pyruvate/acetoin dehydrogenase alpha subunit